MLTATLVSCIGIFLLHIVLQLTIGTRFSKKKLVISHSQIFYFLLSTIVFGFSIGYSYEICSTNQNSTNILTDFLLLVLGHDIFFYFCHRFLHIPFLYKNVHSVHHSARHPYPLNAMVMHPFEAGLDSSYFFLMVLTFQINQIAFASFALFMLLANAIGHMGINLIPTQPTWGILNLLSQEPDHRNHHQMVNENFGAYTRIWDRLFGTLRKSA